MEPDHRSHPAARPDAPSRRAVLRAGAVVGGLTAATVLAGCGDDADSASGGADDARFTGALIASFPQSDPYVAAGVPARLPYLIADREGVPLRHIDGSVRFVVRRDGEQVGEPIDVEPHGDGVPRAYLPLELTFDEPGVHDVIATYQGAELDGSLQVVERSAVTTPMVGDPVPSIPSPTTADALGVDPLCTRDTPCPYHAISLDVALASGRPTILLVSTPAYCQTAVCGPILDMLIEQVGDRPDVNVIHSEVYADPAAVDDLSQATLAPVPARFGLVFEPALFVIDAGGTVVARGDLIVDRAELAEMVAPVL